MNGKVVYLAFPNRTSLNTYLISAYLTLTLNIYILPIFYTFSSPSFFLTSHFTFLSLADSTYQSVYPIVMASKSSQPERLPIIHKDTIIVAVTLPTLP